MWGTMPENFKVGKNLVLEIFRPKMAQNRPKRPYWMIRWPKISNVWFFKSINTLVRFVRLARCSSQLQLSPRPKMSVCLSVGLSVYHKKLWYFHSNDFSETLHHVRHWKTMSRDRAGLSKKILDHPQNTKMWSKWHFFDFFSKTALTILTKLAQKVELINSEHLPKTACPKKFPFLRYSSTKSRFWPKMPKTVSKDRAISPEP